jgi:endonuclease YncB( thermonuclease family)
LAGTLPLAGIGRVSQEPILHGRCVGVMDGDTIRVLTADQQQFRIRLAWIDAPEKGQAFSSKAKQAMSELVFDKEAELRGACNRSVRPAGLLSFRRGERRRP